MRQIVASMLLTACALASAEGLPPVAAPVPAPAPAPAAKPAALTLADLPPAVRAALEKQAAGATVERIKAEERGGEKTYSGRWVVGEVRSEARLAADGHLLRLKAERKGKTGTLPLDRLPEAVRTAVAARVGDGQVGKIEQQEEKGKTVYSVEIVRAADRLELDLTPEGVISDEAVKPLEGKKDKAGTEGKKPKDDKPESKPVH